MSPSTNNHSLQFNSRSFYILLFSQSYTGRMKEQVIELWSALARSLYNLQKSFFHSRKDQTWLSPFLWNLKKGSAPTIFVKLAERLSKHESNENCRSESHISTSKNYYGSEFLGFTWRHGGHICVPKQRNGGMIVSLTNPQGIEFYSYANFFFCLD